MQPDTLGGLSSPPGRTQHYRPGAEFPKQLEKLLFLAKTRRKLIKVDQGLAQVETRAPLQPNF